MPSVRRSIGIAAGTIVGILVVALVVLGAPRVDGRAAAQDTGSTPVVTPTPPATMNVSGHGAVTLVPDTASVSIGVTTNEDTLAEAQAEATTRMDAIIAVVLDAGVEERDIQTTSYSVNIVYDYDDDGTPTRIIGYEVRNQISVKIRVLDSLGPLLDTVVAAGANTISGITFFVEDTSAAASQARELAVDDAMRKAEQLANAAGLEVARVTYITESYSPPPAPTSFAGEAAAAAPGASVPVQAGTAQVSVDVQMSFELRERAS